MGESTNRSNSCHRLIIIPLQSKLIKLSFMIMQMCIFWVNMNYETREAPTMFQDSEP